MDRGLILHKSVNAKDFSAAKGCPPLQGKSRRQWAICAKPFGQPILRCLVAKNPACRRTACGAGFSTKVPRNMGRQTPIHKCPQVLGRGHERADVSRAYEGWRGHGVGGRQDRISGARGEPRCRRHPAAPAVGRSFGRGRARRLCSRRHRCGNAAPCRRCGRGSAPAAGDHRGWGPGRRLPAIVRPRRGVGEAGCRRRRDCAGPRTAWH